MRDGWRSTAHRVRAAPQFLQALQNRRLIFRCHRGRALRIPIVNANKLHVAEFAVYARVVTPEFAGTYDGDTDLPCFCRRAHSLLIPLVASFGSATGAGGNA